MTWPNRTAWIFAVNCCLAALLALAIGFWLDLPRPYWAAMTVFITSQPLSGAVRQKALYRTAGTLLGAGFAVLVVPLLVDMPLLLCLAIALWVGLCLGLSLLDRTPRAYVVMLAGYTAALIAFPSVDQPGQVFDVAVARVEEIIVGVAAATLVHTLIFPVAVGTVLRQRLREWLTEGDGWARDLLRDDAAGRDPIRVAADRRHLAAAITEIQLLAVILPFDVLLLPGLVLGVKALHHRMLLLIPVLSGVGDRLSALRDAGEVVDPLVRRIMTQVADWIDAGAPASDSAALLQQVDAAKGVILPTDWIAMLHCSLLSRLHDLIVQLGEAHQLLVCVQAAKPEIPDNLLPEQPAASRRFHADPGVAVISGFAAALAIGLVCLVWIETGWVGGGIAAAMAGVFCALFAALDDPTPSMGRFGLLTGLAIPVAGVYQIAILPAIDGLPLLAASLAPIFLLCGLGMVARRTAQAALAFSVGFCAALALQESYSLDFAAFLNGNLGQYVGLFAAILVTRSCRVMSVETAARRLVLRSWAMMADLALRADGAADVGQVSELIDRVGLLAPKLAAMTPESSLDAVDILMDLRIAMNLILVQRHRGDYPPEEAGAIDALLARLGDYFSALAARRKPPAKEPLLSAIDQCLAAAAAGAAETLPAARYAGVTALVGLRRNLFPTAIAFPKTMLEGGGP